MRLVHSSEFIVHSLIAVLILFLLPTTNSELITVHAQTTSCGTTTTPRAQGLVSTPNISATSQFGTTGGCIIDPKAAFAPFKIPTYEDLKQLYYTQSKANKAPQITGDGTQTNLSATQDTVYYITGNLNLTGNPTATGNLVIFVDGALNISTANYTYGSATTGTLFIVKGNVNIDATTVGQVNAVIISAGTICTATQSGTCPASNVTVSSVSCGSAQTGLCINGSLISLDQTKPILFRRVLADNSNPAEKIVHQVKYLVLLRNLYSDTLQKWSEIPASGVVATASPIPFAYSMSASGNISATQGGSGSNSVTATITSGLTKSVTFSASGLPSGATASFSPTSCNITCSSTLTITTAPTTPTGSSTITVSATPSGGTAQFTLNVISGAPVVTTNFPTDLTFTSATLNGSANPNGLSSTGYFRYSTTNPVSCSEALGIRVPLSGGSALGSGTSGVAYSQPLSGLATDTLYYFCAIASNVANTGFGQIYPFRVCTNPAVIGPTAIIGTMLCI